MVCPRAGLEELGRLWYKFSVTKWTSAKGVNSIVTIVNSNACLKFADGVDTEFSYQKTNGKMNLNF
jgi:hypothetical protein